MRRTTETVPRPGTATGRLQLTSEGLLWLIAAILLGAIGWWKSANVVLLLAYFMGALLLLNGLLARAHARRVTVSREPAPPSYAGEDVAIQITVTNVGSSVATVTVEDETPGEPVRWLFHRLPPTAASPCILRRVFPRRGRFPAPVRVSSGFPLGLLQFDRLAGGSDVVVLPASGVADPDGLQRWVHRHAGGSGQARKVLRRVTTDQADVRGVRPYRPGDPIRTIHWRSSARRGALMVREYDAAPAPALLLVVEPWLPSSPTTTDHEALEAALSLTVTIIHAWSRLYGTLVTLAVAGDPSSVRTTTSTDRGVREALSPLAEVEGGTEFAPLNPEAFDRSLAKAARVLVSSRPNSPYGASLRASTGRPFVATSPADHPPWYEPPSLPRS